MTEVNAAGIDVAKGKSIISFMHPLGEVVAKPLNVSQIVSEHRKLADFLKKPGR